MDNGSHNPNAIKRFWTLLRQPSAKYSLLTLLIVGFFSGIIFWGGFNTGMEATNSLAFCTTCHEMRDTVFQEYKETIHYSNRTGVRAICSDCHVPKDWVHKMIRKSKASFEVWGKLTGSIDTMEKFEAKRMTLATHEWDRMKETGSRECRNCHSFEAMSGNIQKQSVYTKHIAAQNEGKTCIDCHKGIAHHLPKEYHDPNEDE
jgi:cytochrome c-type protein NapC